MGRESEHRTAVDSSVPQHDRGIDPRRCRLVGQTGHSGTLIQLLGRVDVRVSDLRSAPGQHSQVRRLRTSRQAVKLRYTRSQGLQGEAVWEGLFTN